MPRSYVTADLTNSNKLNEIAGLINGKFTEALGFLDTSIPNTSHAIPATPTAGQILSALNTNTLQWLTITSLIKAGTPSTAYLANDLILFSQNLYLVLNNYTSGGSFDPLNVNLKQISGLTSSEVNVTVTGYQAPVINYADSAPNRTYTVIDGKTYWIDPLAGGITTEIFRLPVLNDTSPTRFSFTVRPRKRSFAANSLTITRNPSDNTAVFYQLLAPTTLIADDITLVTDGEYEFVGYRDTGVSTWQINKRSV
jgi:hypothetical protein